MRLNKYLNEKINFKKLPWNGNPNIGWWLDNNPITFYHGTHEDNLENISKHGLKSDDYISLALEPNTAFGYANMHGGERQFEKKPKTVPPDKRVVLVIKIPRNIVLDNMITNWRPMPSVEGKLSDESRYEKHKGKDNQYYQLTEVRMPNNISPKYIVGYMKK